MGYENSPASKDRNQKIKFTDAIDVDGYLREQAAQDSANKQMVKTAHEAIAETPPPAISNPYSDVKPQMGPSAPHAEILKEEPVVTPPQMEMYNGEKRSEPQSEEKKAPKSEGFNFTNMMAAATPLLVDFLTGGGEGSQISANAFLKEGYPDPKSSKNKTDLEIQQLKLAAEKVRTARAMAGTGKDGKALNKNQVATFLKPDGTKQLATWNQGVENGWQLDPTASQEELLKANQIGDYFVPDKGWMKVPHSEALKNGYHPVDPGVARYNQTTSMDKEADRNLRKELADKKIAEMKQKGADAKQIKAFEKFTSASSPYQKAEDGVYGAVNAMDMLNKGGVIGANGLPTVIAKQIFKEVGNLSSTDLSMAKGNQGAVSLAQRLYNKMSTGELGPEDRKDVETVIKAAYDHAYWKAGQVKEKFKRGYKATGVNMDEPFDTYASLPGFPALQAPIPSAHNSPAKSPSVATPNRAAQRPGTGMIQVTRKSDGMSIQMAPDKAKTLDKSKYSIGN